jgi:hypothetical protein
MKIKYTFSKTIMNVLIMLISFQTSFCQLSGTKVIGSSPSDYTTFSAAVTDLILNGVSGPVVFDVKAGTYTENVYIPKITGASSTNTITFQSQDGSYINTKLTYSPAGYADNYTIWLYAANYITFNNLTLSSGGSTYANVIIIDSLAGNNTFSNNRIVGYTTSQASEDQALIYSSDFDENNNVFTGNLFLYGSYGLYYYGTSNKESGTEITDNSFSNQYYSAIYVSNQNAPLISGNDIYSNSTNSFRAIHVQYCTNNMVINKNKIDIPASTGGYGMYITNGESSAGNEALISNNFIHINTDNATCSGISCISSNFQKFFYNSVNITGVNINSTAFSFEGYGSEGLQIKNNIFSNKAQGLAVYCFLSTTLFSSDYNDFYSNGTNLCNYYGDLPTLASWITATSNDSHSKNVDPSFVSDSDLHTSATPLASAAIAVPDVTDDIDGDSRGNTPDIGADEFEFTGIDFYSNNSAVQIFPNPSTGVISVINVKMKNTEYTVYDIRGRLIETLRPESDSPTRFNISNLSDGLYFLRIQGKDMDIFQKFRKISD